MERTQLLENWIKDQFPEKVFTLKPASADASFRRYFRVFIDDRTFVVMDAPPQHEDCRPFLQVADILSATGVHVPNILAQNLEHGFLLLSDLGNTTFLQALTSDTARVDQLYADAIDALIQMQLSQRTEGLPDYDETLLLRELNLFPDWYIAKHLGKALSDQQTVMLSTIFARILANNLAQPKVLVHRDYHSRNLMVSTPNPGIIDFQDAVVGPVTYDLVSLFKDAYVYWDEERVLDWVIRYWEKARKAGLPVGDDFGAFYRGVEWMGLQRHLKVAGIFARLTLRDGKPQYLADAPRFINYIRATASRYRELKPLLRLVDQVEGTQAASGFAFGRI